MGSIFLESTNRRRVLVWGFLGSFEMLTGDYGSTRSDSRSRAFSLNGPS